MSVAPLLSPAELSTLQQVVLRRHTQRRIAGAAPQPGALPTAWRGAGMELLESRPYRAGDDPRHLDWRATARHGRPITKVFRAERQRANFIVIDRSINMAFGTRRQLKATLAAHAGAILVFSALADNEAVGGMVLAPQQEVHLGGRSLTAVMSLIKTISAALPTHNTVAALDANVWRAAEQATTRGTHIYVLSDFEHFSNSDVQPLASLASTRRITALILSDPAEAQLPNVGKLRITSPLSGQQGVIDTSDNDLRTHYAAQREQHRQLLLRRLRDADVDAHVLSTAHDALSQLQALAL